MAQPIELDFPGGSRSRVNRAGDNVRLGNATAEDLEVIDAWRAAHRGVLNTFQAILRARTRGTVITVAQRHKRKRTIFNKLDRFPKMLLSRFDDVAGCRLIFENIEELYSFRESFLSSARFKHKRRNANNKYDYILAPKATGYRGVHDVYEYVNSKVGKNLAGLNVEIQYRTLVQHAWATAVEVIGFVTQSQPKFQEGDRRYEEAMALASEILARAHEKCKGPFPDLDDRELVNRFSRLDKELGLLRILRGLNAANNAVSDTPNAILIFNPKGQLEVRSFSDSRNALRELFRLEREMPDRDIVLVRPNASGEVRLAFRNYFSDASDFISLIEDGLRSLTPLTSWKSLTARLRVALNNLHN